MILSCGACNRTFDTGGEGWPGDVVKCLHCGADVRLPEAKTGVTPPGGEARPLALEEGEVLPLGAMLGQYRIAGFIGKGGMGSVYRGVHTMLQRPVAVKVLPPKFARDGEFVERFKREALALANLSHPNVVAIHDMGVQGDIYYFVMEYVEGATLRDLMNQRRVAQTEALQIVPQVCSALEYAHTKGIIHRDIKPENIILDRQGQVKIADFGLAKIVRGERATTALTMTNVVMGTMEYMAPEQRDSMKGVDHRADIYSTGVVLYEMLTGDVPMGHFELPSRRAGVDERFDGVILKALEQDPARRYQRASELGRDVDEVRTTVKHPPELPLGEPPASPGRLREFKENAPKLPWLLYPLLGALTAGHMSVFYLYRILRWLRDVTESLRTLGHRVPRHNREDWEEIEEVGRPASRMWWFPPLWGAIALMMIGLNLLQGAPPRHRAFAGGTFFLMGAYLGTITLHVLYLVFEAKVGRYAREIIDRAECLAGGKSEWAMLRYRLSWTTMRVVMHGVVIALSLVPFLLGSIVLIFYPLGLCIFWNSRLGTVRKILRTAGAVAEGVPTDSSRGPLCPSPSCGRENLTGARFCTHCGTAMTTST